MRWSKAGRGCQDGIYTLHSLRAGWWATRCVPNLKPAPETEDSGEEKKYVYSDSLPFLMDFIHWERERAQAEGSSRERGGGKSQADSVLSMEHEEGLDLKTLRAWPELKPRARCSTNWAILARVFNFFTSVFNLTQNFDLPDCSQLAGWMMCQVWLVMAHVDSSAKGRNWFFLRWDWCFVPH